MIRQRGTLAKLSLVALGLIALSRQMQAQQGPDMSAVEDALVHWDTTCWSGKGCIMQTDVLRGHADSSVDANDVREYIGLSVLIAKSTRRPQYITIGVDPRVQKEQGVFIAFPRRDGQGNFGLDETGAVRLAIDSCKDDGCTIRIPNGVIIDSEHAQGVDVLDKFLHSPSMLVLYFRGGKKYETMILLASFKREYDLVMKQKLDEAPKQ